MPPTSPLDQEFLRQLYEEKGRTQQARAALVVQKLLFSTGLLGLGSINLGSGPVNTSPAILLAPLVALVFDFYIMGEDYGVKRIGYYLQTRAVSRVEKEWEEFVSARRDPFAPWAMPALTLALTAGAGMLAWSMLALDHRVLVGWLAFCALTSLGTFAFYNQLRRRLVSTPAGPAGGDRRLERKLAALRRLVERENHQLSRPVYAGIKDLFEYVTRAVPYMERERMISPEYHRPEFLACVDEQGEKLPAPPEALDDYRHAAVRSPEIKAWFRADVTPDGKPALLPARWLCHALGLRHGTAHLVLTGADERQDALVQVRASCKVEAPGCYDLPVAGHVDGMQTYLETLRKEAREELVLDISRLVDLRDLGGYPLRHASSDPRVFNVEYHRVYSARIEPAEIPGLRPAPDEVAAVVVLPRAELRAMMRAAPTMFAAGIHGTLTEFPLPD
jgi:isopentenyldiphosphate isomerase